jgi:hypothetical protein
MATTKIRSTSIVDGQVAIADIVGGGAAAAGTFLKQDGTWAAAGAKDDIFWENNTTVSDDYTLTGKNAVSAGPITVADTKTVTVADGYVWVIV